MSIILTATANTDAARARATAAGKPDPGPFTRRLHKPTCDRIRQADDPVDVEQHVPEYATQILAAAQCTRCKPRDFDRTVAAALDASPEQPKVKVQQHPSLRAGASNPEHTPRRNARQPGGTALTVDTTPTKDGRVLAVTPSVYPEVTDDTPLVCATDGAELPGRKFSYLVRKGSGDGRMVECRKHWEERLAANKAARAAGTPVTKAPHVPAEYVQPKG